MKERRAGQYAREMVHRLLLVSAIASTMGLVAGLVTARLLHSRTSAALLAVIAFIFPFATNNSLRRDIEAWLKGARGEETVGRILDGLHAEGFRAIHDLQVDGKWNIDHMVFGPTGAFAIETKAWEGRAYVARGRLMHNGAAADDAIRQATSEAMFVKERLRAAGFDLWVESFVVLTRIRLKKAMTFGPVTVIDDRELAERLGRPRKRVLTPHEIGRCVAAIMRDPAMTIRVLPTLDESAPRRLHPE